MPEREIIELQVDERPAVAAAGRANAALRGTESTAHSVAGSIENAFGSMAKSLIRVTEAAGGIALAIGSMKSLAIVAAENIGTFDRLINTARAAELSIASMSGAFAVTMTAIPIAAAIATEATIKLVLARRQLYEQESILAARTNVSFTAAATLGILDRSGRPGASEVFAGMSPLAIRNLAREFEDLEDPVDRADKAFQLFGSNSGKALQLLQGDLRGDVGAAFELATTIDKDTRIAIQHLSDDLHSLGNPIREIRNDFLSLIETAKTKIVVTVATAYEGVRTEFKENPDAAQQLARARLGMVSSAWTAGDIPNYLMIQKLMESSRPTGTITIGGHEMSSSLEGGPSLTGGNTVPGLIAQALASRLGGLGVTPLGGMFEAQMSGGGGLSRMPGMQLESVNAQLAGYMQKYTTLLGEGITPPPDWDKAIEGLKARQKSLEQSEAFIRSVDEIIAQTRRTVPSLLFGKLYVTSPFEQKLSEQTGEILKKAPSGRENFELSQAPQAFDLRNLQAMLLQYQLPGNLPRTEGQVRGGAFDITGLKITQEDRSKENQIQLEFLSHETEMQERLVKLTWGEDARDGVTAIYNLRVEYAQKEYEINRESMGDLLAGYKELEQIDKARIAAAEQMAEIHDRQMQSIARPAESLINTLFTHPQNFGRQLSTTLSGAALSPITRGLAGIVAQAGAPFIYGAGGQGGISGMFHNMFPGESGGGEGIPPGVVMQGAGGGVASIPYPSSLMIGGGGTGALPFSPFIDPMLAMAMGGGFAAGGGTGFAALAPILGAPGGTAAFSRAAVGGGGGLLPGFGGGTSSGGLFGNVSRMSLASLRQNFFNTGSIATGSGAATTAAGIGGWQGTAAGILTSQGAASLETGIGMPLATAGILGSNRGTGTGILESTFGGALTGAGIGTMLLPGIGTAIGAGVGAAVGAGISLGEMLAGIIAPWKKATDDVKQRYGINIDRNTANHIVDLANQKYGGNISVAVSSPDVRQMLQLYAAATGQKQTLVSSSTTPHAASLVEQGGQLYQQATYQYGAPSVFQSKLPTLGGGNDVGIWPTTGGGSSFPQSGPGPMSLSISVAGKGAADFMAGSVVTPDYVQAQWASAQQGSNGRLQNSALTQSPGSIVQ